MAVYSPVHAHTGSPVQTFPTYEEAGVAGLIILQKHGLGSVAILPFCGAYAVKWRGWPNCWLRENGKVV